MNNFTNTLYYQKYFEQMHLLYINYNRFINFFRNQNTLMYLIWKIDLSTEKNFVLKINKQLFLNCYSCKYLQSILLVWCVQCVHIYFKCFNCNSLYFECLDFVFIDLSYCSINLPMPVRVLDLCFYKVISHDSHF